MLDALNLFGHILFSSRQASSTSPFSLHSDGFNLEVPLIILLLLILYVDALLLLVAASNITKEKVDFFYTQEFPPLILFVLYSM